MKWFKLEELVDRKTFQQFGYTCWQRFPPDSLTMLDNLREFFGMTLICNNWLQAGQFSFRGYRPYWCAVGAKGSYHRKGMAFDLDVANHTAEEARQQILADQDNPLLSLIYRLEGGIDWLHVDCGSVPEGKKRIYVFKA